MLYCARSLRARSVTVDAVSVAIASNAREGWGERTFELQIVDQSLLLRGCKVELPLLERTLLKRRGAGFGGHFLARHIACRAFVVRRSHLVRFALDSASGRHFADVVYSGADEE